MLHKNRENRKEESKNRFYEAYQKDTTAKKKEWQQNDSLFECNGKTAIARREETKNGTCECSKNERAILWKKERGERSGNCLKFAKYEKRRDSRPQPIRACHVSMEREALQS